MVSTRHATLVACVYSARHVLHSTLPFTALYRSGAGPCSNALCLAGCSMLYDAVPGYCHHWYCYHRCACKLLLTNNMICTVVSHTNTTHTRGGIALYCNILHHCTVSVMSIRCPVTVRRPVTMPQRHFTMPRCAGDRERAPGKAARRDLWRYL